MCDFSLHTLKSRPAKVGDKLIIHNFGTGTTGFAAPDDLTTAVCVRPGTEIAFDKAIEVNNAFFGTKKKPTRVAIFRQINKETVVAHHDALELPDGTTFLLTCMPEGQTATILQLPAAPRNEQEAIDQERVAYTG